MLTRLLALSRYFTVVAVIGILLASVALLMYEAVVVVTGLVNVVNSASSGEIYPKLAKMLAVAVIEAVRHLPDRDRRANDRPWPVPPVCRP